MPDQQSSQNPSGDADSQSLSAAEVISAIQKRVMALEANRSSDAKEDPTKKLLGDVKKAEWWMIGINAATLITTIVIACIYVHQLDQMRLATQASINGVDFARETSDANSSQFERTMRQIVDQTISQYDSAQAANKTATTSKNSFEDTVRPYIGVDEISVKSNPKANTFNFSVILRNFGPVPATNFTVDIKIMSNEEETGSMVPVVPRIFNPNTTDILDFPGTPGSYAAIAGGHQPVKIYLSWSYSWRKHTEGKCIEQHYDIKINAFIEDGPSCGPLKKALTR
jgi:hypothetical protein